MKTKNKKDVEIKTIFIDDLNKNSIITHNTDKTIILYLNLESEGGRERKVGVITKSNKTIKIVRNRGKHLFNKLNAYGFNEYILKNTKRFDKIHLMDELNEWLIPVQFILDNGKYMNFKTQGFEVQKFVSLSQIEQFKIDNDETF